MLKTTLFLFLLAFSVNGDELSKQTVEDYLNLIEKNLFTVEKKCWSEKQEKGADMVAREVKKDFSQIKTDLLKHEGDLALPWYNAIKDLCETAENITKDVSSTWNDDPFHFCMTGEGDHQVLLYGLSTEAANDWIGLSKQFSQGQTAFLKPLHDAALKAQADSLPVTGDEAQKCKDDLLKDSLSKVDKAVTELKYYVDSLEKLEVKEGEHPPYYYNERKDALRTRMTTLAGFPCITIRTVKKRVTTLANGIKDCA